MRTILPNKKKTSAAEESINKTASVRKAAEKYENKNLNSDTSANSNNIIRLRSKSIGNARKDQFEEGSGLPQKTKTSLPWAAKSPANVSQKEPIRNKGYSLQLSKSSDSITAAKLLAKARAQQQNNNSGLRINQNFSKSMEKQLDVYSKTKEEIRLILSLAKSGSVNDRIALFSNKVSVDPPTIDTDAKAESIRREIQEARAKAQETVSDTEIEFQEPVESKVKPLKIPMKPKLIDKSDASQDTNTSNSQEARRRPSVEELPSVQAKISNYLTATEEAHVTGPQSETPKLKPILKLSNEHSDKERSRSPRKKTPKLVSDHYLDPNQSFQIYTQSATDMSATEDESELSKANPMRKRSQTKELCSDDPGPGFLKVPPKETVDRRPGIMKSKSFASTGQFEGSIDNELVTSKKQTMMAFFNSNDSAKPKSIMKPSSSAERSTSAGQPSHSQRRSSLSFITDEVLAEDDFVDIDAQFENLLTKTFEQETKSVLGSRIGETPEKGKGGKDLRGTGNTAVAASVAGQTAAAAAAVGRSDKRQSVSKAFDTTTDAAAVLADRHSRVHKSKSFSAGGTCNIAAGRAPYSEDDHLSAASDMQQINQQIKQGFDPVAALPSSQAARQQHQQSGMKKGSVHVVGTPQQSPSPTQSEYDTADPWDDY